MTSDRSFVFTVVWTESVFTYLRYFVASQLDHSDARFRFLANGCPRSQIELLDAFAERHAEQVVEVLDISPDRMIRHGDALDAVLRLRDDGDFFCFIDSDILATAPFVETFAEMLDGSCDAVTSGRGVWAETDVVPVGHPGVNGEYFYSQSGYLFGSPHFGMYRRAPLVETLDRWGIGFGSSGPDLEEAAKARLSAAGHDYWAYDTGKIANIFFQEDGNTLCHREHPALMHIGGVSHYLFVEDEDRAATLPGWARSMGDPTRFEVSRFTAAVLRALDEDRPPPSVPDGIEPAVADRLTGVRGALVDLVDTYRSR
jgi:hypothetical protein